MPEVRHHHHPKSSRARDFLRQYRFELIGLVVVLLGVFLVFERMNIRTSLLSWLRNTAASLLRGAGRVDNLVNDFLARTSLSDAIGYALILAALIILVLRFRWRLRHSARLTLLTCPKCGGNLHRVHRTRLDHMINTFVPVRRYRCAQRSCNWKGLRVTAPKVLPARSGSSVPGR